MFGGWQSGVLSGSWICRRRFSSADRLLGGVITASTCSRGGQELDGSCSQAALTAQDACELVRSALGAKGSWLTEAIQGRCAHAGAPVLGLGAPRVLQPPRARSRQRSRGPISSSSQHRFAGANRRPPKKTRRNGLRRAPEHRYSIRKCERCDDKRGHPGAAGLRRLAELLIPHLDAKNQSGTGQRRFRIRDVNRVRTRGTSDRRGLTHQQGPQHVGVCAPRSSRHRRNALWAAGRSFPVTAAGSLGCETPPAEFFCFLEPKNKAPRIEPNKAMACRSACGDSLAVRDQSVDREDVEREDRQRPERIRRHHQQLRDGVGAEHDHAGPP
jgi:hypothetical protein